MSSFSTTTAAPASRTRETPAPPTSSTCSWTTDARTWRWAARCRDARTAARRERTIFTATKWRRRCSRSSRLFVRETARPHFRNEFFFFPSIRTQDRGKNRSMKCRLFSEIKTKDFEFFFSSFLFFSVLKKYFILFCCISIQSLYCRPRINYKNYSKNRSQGTNI